MTTTKRIPADDLTPGDVIEDCNRHYGVTAVTPTVDGRVRIDHDFGARTVPAGSHVRIVESW